MAKKNLSKQKKMDTRVNFTPMVDMMMLLITFFMLCTTLAKPQAMVHSWSAQLRRSLMRKAHHLR